MNPAQQARDVEPLLFKCWANVEDGGSTLKQHWLNVSCLLGDWTQDHIQTGGFRLGLQYRTGAGTPAVYMYTCTINGGISLQ